MLPLSPHLTKITRPFPGRCLLRARVFRILDEKRRRVPLLWVCGPPGCGKTMLVSSYLDSREIPALWYQIDEGDRDPAGFFHHLAVAGKRASPRKRKPLPVLTPEYLPGIRSFSRLFFEHLFSRLSPDHALVFDDCQEVPADSPLHDLIAAGMTRLPEGNTLILISRHGPPPAFSRLRVDLRMEILGWDDLRLDLAECGEIARLRAGKRQSHATIRRLQEMTGGWAAGLVLLLERAKRSGIEAEQASVRAPGEVFDYFGREIFDRATKPVRDFLMKTSVLPDMTARTAEALTGQKRTPQLLSVLSDNHFFLTVHLHSEPLYRYHPLFHEFLRSRANEVLGTTEMHALRRRAAAALEKEGRIEDAAGLYAESGDPDSLARLILAHAASWLYQGRNRMLEEWLKRLPEKTLRNDPWLLLWLGKCRMAFDPAGSRSRLEESFDLFRKRSDPEGVYRSWSLIMDGLCLYLNDFQAIDEWIDRFGEIRERFPTFPSPEIEARAVASLLGGLYLRRGDHPDLPAWVKKASAMIQECRDLRVRLQVTLYLFNYYIWIGDFPAASRIVDMTREWISSSTGVPQARILFHLFEARLHCGLARFDDSIRSVARGLEIARASGIHFWDFLLLSEGASASLGNGDLDLAGQYLRRMGSHPGTDQPFPQAYLHHLSAWRAAIAGDIPLALSYEETADVLITDCGAPCGIALGKAHMARLRNELGDTAAAADHLEKAVRIAGRVNSSMLDFQCLLVEADIAFLRGDRESGRAALGKALSLGREKGFFHYDNWTPPFMTRLCRIALEEGIEVSYVRELIRKRKLVPDSPPLEIEQWPWPVRIYTLGRFGILREDRPLTFSRKVQKRPLSLLKALIALGGRTVREDRIADAVWPEAEGDLAIQSMSVALRRLRQLLGREEAVQRREGVLSLDPRVCWVDAFAFERLLGIAVSAAETGSGEIQTDLEEKALGLYRGPFLAEERDRPWTVSMRERLRSRYLTAVRRLGARRMREGQWEKARDCYRKGIDVDNLAEEFYQDLIRCYLADGRNAEALSVYHRLEKTFSSLGVEPSPKTRDLLKSFCSA